MLRIANGVPLTATLGAMRVGLICTRAHALDASVAATSRQRRLIVSAGDEIPSLSSFHVGHAAGKEKKSADQIQKVYISESIHRE